MNRFMLTILIPLVAGAATLPPGFNPGKWPGRMPPEKAEPLKQLMKQLQEAQRKRDLPAMRRLVPELASKMGDFAGVPENKPEYSPVKTFDPPDAARIARLTRQAMEALRGRHPECN